MAVPASATPADAVLDGLNTAQREAVLATTGPVAILAGAGTGKTRVISRRAAYAIATGATVADQVLLVTFSDRAAGEMAARISRLGQPGVTARTFHAHALSQLRWFWPSRHDGADLPRILESKAAIIGRLARALPGGYRFTPTKDLADEIEWAKSRRLGPADVRRRGRGRRPRAANPAGTVRPAVRRLRALEAARGTHRLRRHAHADRRPARDRRRQPSASSSRANAGSAWTSTRTPTRSRSDSSSCGSAMAATCAWWATRTRRSTRSRARRRRSSRASTRGTRARGSSA